MKPNIKPIETLYNGYRFRSRLEARWAVFFDALGIKYEYEKEGYDLGELGWYLPDFWLPEYGWVFDVKPYIPDAIEREKIFATGAKILVGSPWITIDRYGDIQKSDYVILGEEDGYTTEGLFAICRSCLESLMIAGTAISIGEGWIDNQSAESPGWGGWWPCDCGCAKEDYEKPPLPDENKLVFAYTAARSARFEHGEKPMLPQAVSR